MNFQPDLAAKVMAGEKTVTRRLVSDNPRSPWWREKCGYRVGQEVAICPGRGQHAIGRAEITSVDQGPLGWLGEDEALAEGFRPAGSGFARSSDLFVAAWTKINGRYKPGAIVWRVGLKAIEEEG
jgi:hypothetical protein